MRRFLLTVCFLVLWSSFAFSATCRPPDLPSNPTIEQIMKRWFDIKFTRYADDAIYIGQIVMIDKTGFRRTKKWIRRRLIMRGKKGIDYKDLVVMTYPEYTKGLAVLTWAYLDVRKQNDIWLWLPSLKKVRKISQAEEDDAFLGSEFTVEDITTRRYGYETYKLLGEDTFPGYTSHFDKKTYFKGTPCYKIKGIPKKKDWYYSYRIMWVDKKTGIPIFDEFYDKAGRKFKVFLRYYFTPEDDCWVARLWEIYNFRTGHTDCVDIKEYKFNIGLKERHFSPRILERMEW
ncbi:MAG TPA: outer membrane lipoprotein-sorting protein [Candidatus Desulfofervidus auxilii]|uniref:Outer membrane lipoprotein-sorting protein n=1 Tax=Desulfofervidus auxilii TaxID=1621989 RepID=A0A7V0NEY4_DESA2|nr:outer membrane lipoprotein-sorting protein [Candidatus Desulfofervidus auxilii]